jgi:neopullulanase
MSIQTPDWVKDAVFYQIFPDRFSRSLRSVQPNGTRFKPWGSPPEEQGYQGGDLYGIVDRLDYLADLGVTALYLNPIFSSASNHRYHTFDYLAIDPLLGGDDALRELLTAAHARDMRVILDGVFNHTGRGFWAFHHILENGGDSPYIDWFLVQDWPLRPYVHDAEHPHNYEAWWGIPALPKFNIANPGVRDYLLHVAQYWIEFGVDGWRLDVPEEIDDQAFWRDFRRVVKQSNPDAYLVGEIWGEATDWLQGDRFDGVMNYVFNRAALGFFGADTLRTDYKPGGYSLQPHDAAGFDQQIRTMHDLYSWDVTLTQLNLMDSHDTARTLWTVGGDESALRLCTLFQMTMPGAPCIYYGDEIGMNGPDDPGCRGAFPWEDEEEQDRELFDYFRRAIALRRRLPALRTGSFVTLYVHEKVYAFARHLGDEHVLVVFNAGSAPATIDLTLDRSDQDGRWYEGVWQNGRYRADNGRLTGITVPARDAAVLVVS